MGLNWELAQTLGFPSGIDMVDLIDDEFINWYSTGRDSAIMTNEKIHLPVNNIREFLVSKFRMDLIEAKTSLVSIELDLEADTKTFKAFIRKYPGLVTEDIHSRLGNSIYRSHANDCIVEYTPEDKMMNVVVMGTAEAVERYSAELSKEFPKPTAYIRWVFDPQSMMSQTIPVDKKNKPFSEMYPFLGEETLEEYYDRFMASDAGILLLTGPPGTGKTSFIRGLLNHAEENCILTYSPQLLGQDSFFAEWLGDDDEKIVVIEDSDMMLGARKEGNHLMHRFLNLGDGLITVPGKKMIFSTNLTSLDQVDSALTRPGRCHDVLEFRKLTFLEAEKVAKIGGTTIENSQHDWTIAEIFSNLRTRKEVAPKKSFGFLAGK